MGKKQSKLAQTKSLLNISQLVCSYLRLIYFTAHFIDTNHQNNFIGVNTPYCFPQDQTKSEAKKFITTNHPSQIDDSKPTIE